MGVSTTAAGYRFGPFALDVRTGELMRNGYRIPLQEKPCSVLTALLERPGALITREELRQRLWPEDTFVSFEDGLNTAVRKLREALGDDSNAPAYVETIRGRGYRFIGEVEEIPAAVSVSAASAEAVGQNAGFAGAPSGEQPAAASAPRRWEPIAAILAACLVAAAGAMLVLHWRAVHASRISIVVLPFANMTGDASRDYICNGMTEELIARLGRLAPERLRVIAPTSAKMYANSSKPAEQIARELNVSYLMQGSLEQQGANIRVAVQLIRPGDQSRLWANVYEGDLSDQFEFETSVADAVARALSLQVPTLARAEYKPDKYEAHDAYLRGLYFFSQRSKEGFEKAIDSFGDAVAIDPKYATAYAQLANAYNLMGQYNWMSAANARSQAWGAAKQALSLDPNLAEAHAALGFSLWFYQWDMPAAEAEFRKAIALEPDNVDAHHWYEQLLMTAGRFPEAEREMQAALDVDPRSPILRTNLGWLDYFEGKNAQAIEQIQSVVRENPNFLTAHYKLWYVYSTLRNEPPAWQEFQWVVHSIASPARQQSVLEAYRRSGYAGALKAMALVNDPEYYGSMVDGARCMIFAGDREAALRYLELADNQHEGWTIYAPADPAFAPLRTDARFQRLMAAITKGNTPESPVKEIPYATH